MSIHELGNSSSNSTYTFDLLIRNQIKDQTISKGDVLLFVGGGMNVNAFVYRY
jgi:3-oxoacyl-[acyl-carrier-protein] synthase-3